jgi:hypothetical protein
MSLALPPAAHTSATPILTVIPIAQPLCEISAVSNASRSPFHRYTSIILSGFGQEYQEFLTTPAEYRIGFANAVPANPYYCNQHLVADGMPPRVIDFLEVIAVDHQQREHAPVTSPGAVNVFQSGFRRATVEPHPSSDR